MKLTAIALTLLSASVVAQSTKPTVFIVDATPRTVLIQDGPFAVPTRDSVAQLTSMILRTCGGQVDVVSEATPDSYTVRISGSGSVHSYTASKGNVVVASYTVGPFTNPAKGFCKIVK